MLKIKKNTVSYIISHPKYMVLRLKQLLIFQDFLKFLII